MGDNKGFKKISIILLTIFLISNYNVKAAKKSIDLMNISRNTNVQKSIKKGDTFDVTYKIKPEAINAKDFNNNKQKDIVLVIDTSGSMEYIPTKDREPEPHSDEKSRLDIMKNTAQNFITKFIDDGKAKIGLVEYNTAASERFGTVNVKSDNINGLKDAIDKLDAGGSTNIGDGLRTAYYMIANNAQGHDKYIILMTDGEAEAYSSSDKNGNEYFMGAGNPKNNFETLWDDFWVWDGLWRGHWQKYANPDYRNESLDYAKKVASERISPSKIKTFVVGFGSGSVNDKNKQIADAAGGQYCKALDEDSINNIYDEIQKYVEANISASAHFEETFSSNLEVVNSDGLPNGLSVSGSKIVGDINNIYYALNDKKTSYTAKPIEFTVTYRAKANISRDYILGENGNSSFVRYNVSYDDKNNEQTKYFNELRVARSDDRIINHGIYNEKLSGYIKKPDENNTYNITNRIPIKMAMKVKINSDNVEIRLDLAGDFVKEDITFEKYELKDDGTINDGSLEEFLFPSEEFSSSSETSNIIIESSDKFKFEPKKNYILIYTIKPKKCNDNSITINPYIDNEPFEDLNLKLNIIDLPILQ